MPTTRTSTRSGVGVLLVLMVAAVLAGMLATANGGNNSHALPHTKVSEADRTLRLSVEWYNQPLHQVQITYTYHGVKRGPFMADSITNGRYISTAKGAYTAGWRWDDQIDHYDGSQVTLTATAKEPLLVSAGNRRRVTMPASKLQLGCSIQDPIPGAPAGNHAGGGKTAVVCAYPVPPA